MEMYLGICLVTVVIGLTLSLCARLITRGILEERERIAIRRSTRMKETLALVIGKVGELLKNEVEKQKATREEYKELLKKAEEILGTFKKDKPYNSGEFDM